MGESLATEEKQRAQIGYKRRKSSLYSSVISEIKSDYYRDYI
jgi:hypothetical protein